MNKEQGIEKWSKLYDRPISEEECNQIVDNLYDFFAVLKEWNDKQLKAKKSKPSYPKEGIS